MGAPELRKVLGQFRTGVKAVSHKFGAFARATRARDCIFAFLVALEGYWLSVHRFAFPDRRVFFAAVATASAVAFANITNDYFDIDADRVNHPDRPFVMGSLAPAEAYAGAGMTLLVSVFFSVFAGVRMGLITACLNVVALIYNVWAKNLALVGHLFVACSMMMILSAGYFTVDNGEAPLLPALASFLFLLAREFVKSICDASGDLAAGRRSAALLWGETRALWISVALLLCSDLLLLSMAFTRSEPPVRLCYLLTVTLAVILPGLVFAAAALYKTTPRSVKMLAHATTMILFLGFLSFLWLV